MSMTTTSHAPIDADIAPGVTLPYSARLVAGVGACLPHMSTDKMTPVIASLRVCGQYLIATDRYSGGRFEHTRPFEWAALHGADAAPQGNDDAAILLPASAALWLSKQSPKSLGLDYLKNTSAWHAGDDANATEPIDAIAVVIVFERDSITIRYGIAGNVIAVHTFAPLGGNFPPVGRLFDTFKPADEMGDAFGVHRWSGSNLEKVAKGIKVLEPKGAAQFQSSTSREAHRPGPTRVVIGKRFEMLLQPNLIIA